MPTCDSCDRYLSPATVRPDGTCPSCGRHVTVGEQAVAARSSGATGSPADAGDAERVPIPWHLKLAIAALAIYLGWRAFEGIAWLASRIGG